MQLIKASVLLLALFCVSCGSSRKSGGKKKETAKKEVAELENTYWSLFEMDGHEVNTPEDAEEVYIRMNSRKNTLEGFAGCNTLGGKYHGGKGEISFEAMATRMSCPWMDKENFLFNTLEKANRYVINGQHLLLYDDNYLLAVFKAKYNKD